MSNRTERKQKRDIIKVIERNVIEDVQKVWNYPWSEKERMKLVANGLEIIQTAKRNRIRI